MFRAKLKTDKTVQAAVSGSGDIVSFESAFEKPLADLALNITPVQSGEGDPSPTNIRPISGWTGANIGDNRKNFFPQNYRGISTARGLSFEYGTDGSVHISGTSTNTSATVEQLSLPFVLPKGTYTLSGVNSTAAADLLYGRVRGYVNGAASRIIQSGNGTFTLTEAQTVDIAIFIRATISPDVTLYPMIRLATEPDATYEPYLGQTYPITWSDSAGTVYGGTLDVVRGKLRVTHTSVRLGDTPQSRWAMTLASRRFYCSYDKPLGGVCICDRYPYNAGGADKTIRCLATNRAIYITNSDYATVEEFYAAEQDTQIVYELATPIEYDLDPVTINTLLGQNNLWADCGEVENLKLDAVSGKLKFKLIQ